MALFCYVGLPTKHTTGLTFQHKVFMPDSVERWIGTLDKEVLTGKIKSGQDTTTGEERQREGGWGKGWAIVKEALFWGHRIEGVTDFSPNGKK